MPASTTYNPRNGFISHVEPAPMLIRVLIGLLWAPAAFAHTTGTATLVGTLTDPTGAVISGAKVTVVNTGTSFVSESLTTAEGSYYVSYLMPGTYRLTIEAAGFK